MVEGKVKLLREVVKTLQKKNERMEELLEEILTISPLAASNLSLGGVHTDAGVARKESSNKERKTRKSKTKWSKVANWGNGKLAKIAVGSISIAMLLSIALGWGGIGEVSSSLRKRNQGRQQSFRAKSNKMEDSVKVISKDERLPAKSSTHVDREILLQIIEDLAEKCDDDECKCEHRMVACRKSIQQL